MNSILPITNQNSYYEIRLESIGGLGANLCGKLLGELGAMKLDLNAMSFASYGSEKRGSPVKAFIRYCEKPKEIGINSPVEMPHLLGLFHEAMIGKANVAAGVTRDSCIVINTRKNPKQMKEALKLSAGTIYCIDALGIAMEEKTRINMVMLGALVRASGFLPLEAAMEVAKEALGSKYPALLEANLKGIIRGYQEGTKETFASEENEDVSSYVRERSEWGYDNAPIGGVNPCFGSTVSNDLSASREGYVPYFNQEKCINCAMCESTCPDYVFHFAKGIYKGKECMVNQGLNYHHCKGCLRCVEICPTNALTRVLEADYESLPHTMETRGVLKQPESYEEVGANSYVTSEAYLTEQRVDGGLV